MAAKKHTNKSILQDAARQHPLIAPMFDTHPTVAEIALWAEDVYWLRSDFQVEALRLHMTYAPAVKSTLLVLGMARIQARGRELIAAHYHPPNHDAATAIQFFQHMTVYFSLHNPGF